MSSSLQGHIPDPILQVCRRLQTAGFPAYLVGGAIRDLLRNGNHAAPHDFDVATAATPDQVMQLFGRNHTIPTGLQHGTVTVLVDLPSPRNHVEITTFRGETTYQDGRRPDRVVFLQDIDADLQRRDFTINAIAYDPIADLLRDPFGGQQDLAHKRIRAVGDPLARFCEDGLRPLRAVRFVAQLGFAIDPPTVQAIPLTLPVFQKVSRERMREELLKLLAGSFVFQGLRALHDTGLLACLIPEWELSQPPSGLTHAPWPAKREQLMYAIAALPPDPFLRLHLLLLPIAPGELFEAGVQRLKLSTQQSQRLGDPTFWVPLPDPDASTPAEVRRYLASTSDRSRSDRLAIEFALAHLSPDPQRTAQLERLRQCCQAELAAHPPLRIADLALSGQDIMDALQIGPGKAVREHLERLLQAVIEDPGLNTRAALLAMVDPTATTQCSHSEEGQQRQQAPEPPQGPQ